MLLGAIPDGSPNNRSQIVLKRLSLWKGHRRSPADSARTELGSQVTELHGSTFHEAWSLHGQSLAIGSWGYRDTIN
jgi:hypothetical protein